MSVWALLKSSRECGAFCFSRQSYQLGFHCKLCLTFWGWWFQCPYCFQSLCYAFGGCLLPIPLRGSLGLEQWYTAYFSKPLLCFLGCVLQRHTWPWAQDLCQLTQRNVYPYLASIYANILHNHGMLVKTKKLTLIQHY